MADEHRFCPGERYAIIAANPKLRTAVMLFLVDFAPLVLFLAGYLYRDIFVAIVVLMIAMPISLLVKYLATRKLDRMLMWSTIFLFVFGGASLYLRDADFIYWKPTALYWALAIAFLLSQWVGEKPLVKRFFDLVGELPIDHITDRQIRTLNLVWGIFFVVAGILNIVVAYNFSEKVWVNFKVFGLTALTLVFMSVQVYWIVSQLKSETSGGSTERR